LPSALALTDLDPAAFAQWVDGDESPLAGVAGPQHVTWTRTSAAQWNGVTFGEGTKAGARHLRIGLKTPATVGAVLVRGGGSLSVLRADAVYPGDLGDEQQWIAAQRVEDRKLSDAEAGRDDYVLWVLPPNTATRALRFTHTAELTEKTYGGWLGGVFVLGERFANIAPQALAITANNSQDADRINNGSNDSTWKAWDNWEDEAAKPISKENPVSILLVWPQPVPVRSLCALWAGFGAAEVEA
jgi:hypothetical protein